MLVKKIKLKNIRSYVNQEIEFPNGSVLLSGDIGSGKTTVLLAIEFALFGIQKGAVTGEALLRNGANSGEVELELEIHNKKIRLKRILKRKKESVVSDTAFLEVDGCEKELSITELKSFVLNTLNYPPQLLRKQNLIYRYTVYTPQEQMKHILISEPEERIDTIRKVFDVDKYKRIQDSCDVFISKLREINKLKQGQLLDFQFKKTELDKKKKNLEEADKEFQKLLPKFEKIQQKLKEIKKNNDEIKGKVEKLNVLKRNLVEKETELKGKNNQLEDSEERIEQIEEMVLQLKKEIEATKIEDIDKISEELKKVDKEIEKLREEEKKYEIENAALFALKKKMEEDNNKISSLKTCPVCKQEVTEQHRSKINSEIMQESEKISIKMKENESQLKKIRKEMEAVGEKINDLEKKDKMADLLKLKKENLDEREKEKKELEKQTEKIRTVIERIKKMKEDISIKVTKYKDLDSESRKIEQELEKKFFEEKEIIKVKATLEKGKEDAEHEINALEKEIKEKEEISRKLEEISKLQQWLSKQFLLVVQQIEKQIMHKLNIEFNLLFKKWFLMLVDEALEARVDLEFTPFVEQAGYDINYEYLSGGERTALALAYRLALNQVINSMLSKISTKSILILDEPTDGFSSEQLDKIGKVFEEIKSEQLILVSHEQKMENFVNNVINFRKEDNVTRVID